MSILSYKICRDHFLTTISRHLFLVQQQRKLFVNERKILIRQKSLDFNYESFFGTTFKPQIRQNIQNILTGTKKNQVRGRRSIRRVRISIKTQLRSCFAAKTGRELIRIFQKMFVALLERNSVKRKKRNEGGEHLRTCAHGRAFCLLNNSRRSHVLREPMVPEGAIGYARSARIRHN
ncbi:hypothetical protein CEXT_86661 [Caerostris extrusa]|uniref:Uncharacterized protein n=1 Tax=Caerostris extrusa TaxID=172846 RepID=A0AAV4N7M8_CAEEX|nr:hypothetical protein CEXT_86661 [Caerostris extrusa]